ncbi:MAG: DUF2889 domain-containing protein [Solirubrobacterales bacterium]
MYTRKFEVQVEVVPGVGYRSIGRFEDRAHEMEVTLLYQLGTGKVLEADVALIRAPFEECQQGVQAVKNLIGKRVVDFKVNRMIFSEVAGPKGCTHLAELVMESIKARIHAADYERPDWVDQERLEQRYRIWENSFGGSCIHFTEPYWKPYVLKEPPAGNDTGKQA